MTDYVAGHQFDGIGSDQRCHCGIWWYAIWNCDENDIGKTNIAHSGNLSAHELEQIRLKRKNELRFWNAVEAVAAG